MAKKNFYTETRVVEAEKIKSDIDQTQYTMFQSEFQKSSIMEIDLEAIYDNPYQPRLNIDEKDVEELKKSIEEKGLIQPIIVRKKEGGGFEIVAGHRRTAAFRSLGLETIPAIIRNYTNDEMKINVIIENLQREDLSPLELAIAYSEIKSATNADKTQPELTNTALAKMVGKSEGHISQVLSLLNLAAPVQEIVKRRTYKDVLVLNALNKLEKSRQLEILEKIIKEKLDQKSALKLIESTKDTQTSKKIAPIGFELVSNSQNDRFKIVLDLTKIDSAQKQKAIDELSKLIVLLKEQGA